MINHAGVEGGELSGLFVTFCENCENTEKQVTTRTHCTAVCPLRMCFLINCACEKGDVDQEIKLIKQGYIKKSVIQVKITTNQSNKFQRPFSSPSQCRDSDVSGLHEITAKCLYTRVGNPCNCTLTYTDMHANRPIERQTDRQAGRQADRQTDRQTHSDRQTNRLTDRQTDRQTDGQTDR